MEVTEALKEWLKDHPARHAYQYGLLETYVILFDCNGCPCHKHAKAYIDGYNRIIQVIDGLTPMENK